MRHGSRVLTPVGRVSTSWVVVVPVKGTPAAKSRLGGAVASRADLALAMALDTVAAAVQANGVERVLVVTSDQVAAAFEAVGARVVVDESSAGLTAAVERGIRVAREVRVGTARVNIAVLLGDLPALTAAELADCLLLAAAYPLAMVADADGTGTVLITAAPGERHAPAFGPGSRAAHAAAGYIELAVPVGSGLRRDVDTAEQLHSLLASGVGRHTAAAISRQRQLPGTF